jgi:hypothetical protein
MDATEKHVMAWVQGLWGFADAVGNCKVWHEASEALYGAAQACNQADVYDDYQAYSLLASVARERRLDCITSKYKEAA